MLAHTLVVEPFSRGFSGLRAQFSDALFALTAMVAWCCSSPAPTSPTCCSRAPWDAPGTRDSHLARRHARGGSPGSAWRRAWRWRSRAGRAARCSARGPAAFSRTQVLGGSSLPLVFSPDVRVLAFALGLSLVTAVVFGLAPALRAIQVGRIAAIGTNQRQAVGQATTKGMQSLVVFQLALSVVVVFAAFLLGRTLINFTRIDPGFSSESPRDRLLRSDYQRLRVGAVCAARAASGGGGARRAGCGFGIGVDDAVWWPAARRRARFVSRAPRGTVSPNMNWVSSGVFSHRRHSARRGA